jgi:hypothetical protein
MGDPQGDEEESCCPYVLGKDKDRQQNAGKTEADESHPPISVTVTHPAP